jgi:hypothetical protein
VAVVTERASPTWTATIAAVALVVAAHAATLLVPVGARLHPEEAVNATHALLLAHDPPWLGVGLQYKPFCGGCTVDAWLGRLSFAVLGRTVLAWKLVPLASTALLAGAGFRLLRGGRAGWAFAVLLAAPPGQLGGAFTTGWGNHLEATALGVAALTALGPTAGRALGAGLLAGAAIVVSPGAAWAGLAGAVLAGRRGPFLLGAAGPVVAWTALAGAAGRDPSAILAYGGHEGAGVDVRGGLASLADPGVRAVLLGASPWVAGLAALGVVAAVGALGVVRDEPGRRVGVALAAWLLAYLASPFRVGAYIDVLGRPWFGTRYAVPLLVLLLLAVARAVGALASRRPTFAAVLVATVLPSVVAGRLAALHGPVRVDRLVALDPVDAEDWLRRLGPRDAPWLATLTCDGDPACAALHAFGLGFEAARRGEPLPADLPGPAADLTATAWGYGRGLPGCTAPEPTAEALDACAARLRAAGLLEPAVAAALDGALFDTPVEPAPPAPGVPDGDGTAALARAAGYAWAWSLAREGPFDWPDLDGVDPGLARAFAEAVGRRAARRYGDEVDPPPPGVADAFAAGAIAAR